MLQKGDLKFRLQGKKLNGDFALIHIKARRPGSKGTEWLLIKKQDSAVVPHYDIGKYDVSALSGKTMAQIAGDEDAAEWKSSKKASRGGLKAPWLAETLAKIDKKNKKQTAEDTETIKAKVEPSQSVQSASARKKNSNFPASSTISAIKDLPGAVKRAMPSAITPMLATSVEKPFDDAEWLFEIKWDGYRAIVFVEDEKVRLVSRNHNDRTHQFSELQGLGQFVRAKTAVLDGEIVALDEQGRSSFSLMQQRTGIRSSGRRVAGRSDVEVVYYVFDLIYADGYDLRRVPLEERKKALSQIVTADPMLRYSEHFPEHGIALFEAAKQQGLEGILAKRRDSVYEERRSRDWLKIKITQTVDCVIGGYTDPEGTRQHFGALVLGLYNEKKQLIHVGQAGTGFNFATLKEIWQILHKLEMKKSPFDGAVEAVHAHWVKPQRVAEIKFAEWTARNVRRRAKAACPSVHAAEGRQEAGRLHTRISAAKVAKRKLTRFSAFSEKTSYLMSFISSMEP